VTAANGSAIATTQREKASRSCSREHFATARLIVVAWGGFRQRVAVHRCSWSIRSDGVAREYVRQ
jgi:hypothetical protein